MVSISNTHGEKCARCGSALVGLEWEEHVNDREVQDLWHCWNCGDEFITMFASDDEKPPASDITKLFFTSLVME